MTNDAPTPLTDAFMGEYQTEIGWEDFARRLERRCQELEEGMRLAICWVESAQSRKELRALLEKRDG